MFGSCGSLLVADAFGPGVEGGSGAGDGEDSPKATRMNGV